MVRVSLWVHWILAAYHWLISWISLGVWNAQPGPHMLSAVRSGQHLAAGDWGFFAFVTLPAVLFTFAFLRRSVAMLAFALFFDLFWLAMQIQSWWVPYIDGHPKPWQVEYAKGATTKLLPSVGSHVAPDGMHLVISVLLVAAIVTALLAIGPIRSSEIAPCRIV